MNRECAWLLALAGPPALIAAFSAFAPGVAATKSATYTTITVTDMHCNACAKKIAARLYVVPGVLEVRADVKADKAYVVPQKNKQPSPRAIWEAVEAAGFTPVKLIGPGGQFHKKPGR